MRPAQLICLLPLLAGCAAPVAKRSLPAHPKRTTQNVQRTTPPLPPVAASVDSALTFSQAMKGQTAPEDVRNAQRLVNVHYYSFDGKLHEGQIVVHTDLAEDVKKIFEEIEASHFPIAKVIPIEHYGWSDDASVKDDNTSGFNYRKVPATHVLSSHAKGRAIDLNPWENPYMDPIRGTKQTYNPALKGTLTKDSAPVKIFRKHGWAWGGLWRRGRDYQHFEKR